MKTTRHQVAVGPKVSRESAAWLKANFKSSTLGAQTAIECFPRLIDEATTGILGLLSPPEVALLRETINSMPVSLKHSWGSRLPVLVERLETGALRNKLLRTLREISPLGLLALDIRLHRPIR